MVQALVAGAATVDDVLPAVADLGGVHLGGMALGAHDGGLEALKQVVFEEVNDPRGNGAEVARGPHNGSGRGFPDTRTDGAGRHVLRSSAAAVGWIRSHMVDVRMRG